MKYLLEKPRQAFTRALSACGLQDRSDIESYVMALEEYCKTRIGDLEPDPDGRIKVSEYPLLVVDSKERNQRDFHIIVYSDRSCRWYDETERLRTRADRDLIRKYLAGDLRAKQALEREDEFSINATVDEHTYLLLVEREAMLANQYVSSDEILDAIDSALVPHFWKDVNPLLPNRLTRIA